MDAVSIVAIVVLSGMTCFSLGFYFGVSFESEEK